MTKEGLLNFIKDPTTFSLQDKLDIQGEKTAYPYCSLLQILDILSDKATNIYHWEERFSPKVSAYALDRKYLKNYLDKVKETPIVSQQQLSLKEEIEKQKDLEDGVQHQNVDIFDEINSYQEVSFRTAPKEVIVENFLEVQTSKISISEEDELPPLEELEKNSLSMNQGVASETLAALFEKQKNYKMAIETYEQLSLKYPEKSSTFAVQIERLKNLVTE